jgi:hypothetical protein
MHIAHIVTLIIYIVAAYLQTINTTYKNTCLLFGLLQLTSLNLPAQPAHPDRSRQFILKAGPVLTRQSFIDKYFSSQPYDGSIPGADLGIEIHTRKAFHELAVFFSAGTTSPGISSHSDAKTIYAGIDYSHLYAMAQNKNGQLQWLAGGAVSYIYSHRYYSGFINNANSFESALSLGAVIKAVYTFKQPAGLSISDKLVIPVFTLLLQPSYGSQDIEGDQNGNGTSLKSIVSASRLVTFGSYSRITNCLVLCKKITEHHAVSAEYCIDYYHVATLRPVKNATQRFVLSYQLMF